GCAAAVAAKIYAQCIRYYPFVLGAQPVRMIDLAAFYAAVANEGALPKPHAIESIEANGHTVFQYPNTPLPFIGATDPHVLLSAQDHPAGGGGARHRARDRRALTLCRRQDRNHRGCGGRTVYRIHQRCHYRRVGRLRQWQWQASFAWHDRDRRARRLADL